MRAATLSTSAVLALLAVDPCGAASPEPVVFAPIRDALHDSSPERLPGAACDDSENATAFAELDRELTSFLRKRREQEDLLGERRRRSLETARYHLGRDNLHFNLLEDDPPAFEETRDILRSCWLKLVRQRLEERLPIEELRNRFVPADPAGEEENARRRLLISPRFAVGDDPYLGANLRLHGGEEDFLSHLTLGFRQRLENGGDALFVQYEDGNRFLRLEAILDDESYGDQLVLSMRLRLE